MRAKITINRKNNEKCFQTFSEVSSKRSRGAHIFWPVYSYIFTVHLKPTNSRAALCEDFTMQVNSTKLEPAMSGPNSNRNL